MSTSRPLTTEEHVLWDVVEEHLDEATFLLELFESQLEHPTLSLAELASGAEARLLAHVDGLVVGGPPVAERLLAPQMLAADLEQPARVTAAALALLAGGRIELVAPALVHDDPAVRAASVRACVLLADAAVDRWMLSRLNEVTSDHALHALLEFTAARGLEPPNLFGALQSTDRHLAGAAVRAARHGDPRAYLTSLEALLAADDPNLRSAALVTALAARSTHAWAACERWALDETEPDAGAMALYAALGGATHHGALARQLSSPQHRPLALFALGFSGNPTLVPVLLEYLQSPHLRTAKLAAQALSIITGIDLQADEFVAANHPAEDVQQDEAPLPLEQDLEADLSLIPEDALPAPNAAAITRFWRDSSAAFRPGQRYLGGLPYAPGVVLDHLERAPLRRRHMLATALAISSGVWIDTRSFSTVQHAQLAALRAHPPPFTG